jgi:hypothetical protein
MKRAVGEVSDCCQKVKKDLTNLERELAKLKEEMKVTMSKADPLAPVAADVAVSTAVRHRSLLPGSRHPNHQQAHRHQHLLHHWRNLRQ